MADEALIRAEIAARLGVSESLARHWCKLSPAFLVEIHGEDGKVRYSLERFAVVQKLRQRRLTTREINAELARRYPLDGGESSEGISLTDDEPQQPLLPDTGASAQAFMLAAGVAMQSSVNAEALAAAVDRLAAILERQEAQRALPPPEPARYTLRWWWRRILG